MRNKQDVIVIGGPTASGKSQAAAALAVQRGGVIINADSMQLYRALPVLSAAPDADLCARVPHRLYGILPSERLATAAEWSRWAQDEIDAARAAGALPIIVGGTGLYLEALLEGLSEIPPVPEDVRAQGRADIVAVGNDAFRRRLVEADPASAQLNAGDTHRLLRAWEVLQATGRPLSAWQATRVPRDTHDYTCIALLPPRDRLYLACNERFNGMLARGALAEVQALRDTQGERLPVMRTLGARSLMDHLEGRLDLAIAIERAQAATRQYAKRQTTWFGNRFMRRPGTTLVDSPERLLTAI